MKKLLLLICAFSLVLQLNAKDFREQEGNDSIPTPKARMDQFYNMRAYPYDEIPSDVRHNAFAEKDRMIHKQMKKGNFIQAQQPAWKCIGPFEIGGRIKSIVIHPTNTNIVYIGAAAGGIWKTTDGADTWTPIFDFQNSIAFGALAIDEANPETIYAGSGESVTGGSIFLGSGMYKSTDGGTTWTLLGLTDVGAFSKIYVHPKNSNIIVAGATQRGSGFYISKDAGKNWERKNNEPITDLTINPNDENEYMTGVSGIGMQYTTNMGDSWETRSSGLNFTGIGRVSVQMDPNNTKNCYALVEATRTGSTGAAENVGVIVNSSTKGAGWNVVYDGGTGFFNNQGFYDNYMGVHPGISGFFMAGGIDVWQSKSGFNPVNITNVYTGGSVHPDQQCIAFSKKDIDLIYFANDGGLYKSTDRGNSFYEKSNGLAITQFYALAVDPSRKNRNFGGTQDNGSLGNVNQDVWESVLGGDGFQSLVDPFDNNTVVVESQYGNMAKINFSTTPPSYSNMTKGLAASASGNAPFFAPIATDKLTSGLYYHGRRGVWITDDRGASSWIQVLADRPLSSGQPVYCSAIAAGSCPKATDEGKAIAFAGFANGEVWVTQNIENWTQVNQNGLPNRAISYFATSALDYNVAYVALSGYGTPHIFKTTNLGASWTSISENLPNAPVNAIAINPENQANIYAATDIGVFTTYDDGLTWTPFGSGLPNSPVTDLMFHTNRSVLEKLTLRAATHGRSVWEVEIPAEIVTESAITTPIGGEIYIGGTNQRVSWYGFGTNVNISISLDDGATWNLVAQDVVGSTMLMKMPDRSTFKARIKVQSKANPDNFKISNSFTLKQKDKGAVLFENSVSFVPYGIAYDGNDNLWATDVNSPAAGNKAYMYKLNSQTLQVYDKIALQDSIYTDLTINKSNGDFYVHRFTSLAEGSSGFLDRIDKTGKRLNSVTSPAGLYPIGIELVDGNLIVTNRDGNNKRISVLNSTNFSKTADYPNPCNVNFGPRGLAFDGGDYLYHVCTFFPSGGGLTKASVMRINKATFALEGEIKLENAQGLINARGVDYDPRDKNFWVSDYGGNIYKVAGFSTVLSVDEQFDLSNKMIDLNIYPNPMNEQGFISFELKNKSGNVAIELYSNTGQKIGTLFEQNVELNVAKVIEINNDKLTSGIYNLVIKLDGEPLFTKNLTVIK